MKTLALLPLFVSSLATADNGPYWYVQGVATQSYVCEISSEEIDLVKEVAAAKAKLDALSKCRDLNPSANISQGSDVHFNARTLGRVCMQTASQDFVCTSLF